jgi:hypothetical protein
MTRRTVAAIVRLTLTVVVAIGIGGCDRDGEASRMTEVQRVNSGTLDVVLLSPRESLRHGKDTFAVEFRSTPGGSLVDVGDIRATASMPMPGMAMFGNIDVRRTSTPGRYAATGEFEMAGTWRLTLAWDGPAGKGSVAFAGTVQ